MLLAGPRATDSKRKTTKLLQLLTHCAKGEDGAAMEILDYQPDLIALPWHGKDTILGTILGTKVCSTGSTALIMACKSGDVSLVRHLLERDADVNARDKSRFTSLMYAASLLTNSRPELCLLLVEHRADTTSTNTYGDAAIHYYSEDESVRKSVLAQWRQRQAQVAAGEKVEG
jgi:hypothetical protein